MDINELEVEISQFIYELETEDRLNRVGLKDTSQSAKVYKKYQKLFSEGNLKLLKEKISHLQKLKTPSKKQTSELERYQRVYFTLAASFIGLNLAGRQDQVKTFFSKATAKIAGETIPYFQLAPKIAKEVIFNKREIYDTAAAKIITKSNPKQLVILKEEIALIKNLGFANYLKYFSEAKKSITANFIKSPKKLPKPPTKSGKKTQVASL